MVSAEAPGALFSTVAAGFLTAAVRTAFVAAGFAFGLAGAAAVVSAAVSTTGAGSVSVVVSVEAGAMSPGGGGAIVTGSGSAVGGVASCAQAGVEDSARTAAIAGRALAYAYRFVFHIMPVRTEFHVFRMRNYRRPEPALRRIVVRIRL
jgi:hypothetical protein